MENKEYVPLTIPKVNWDAKTLTDTYGQMVAQPLEPGFGTTFGNSLRRVFLGGIEGSAVVSVVIDGINNEFSSLTGVQEDAMQVLLNIKGIVVKNKTGDPGTMRLSVHGDAIATAGDIETDDHLEIVNPDHVIAHVSPGGSLTIEFAVESGRGYQAAQWPVDQPLQQDGRIYIDAMFTPVRNVSFDVTKTRVGKDIDYDKLIVDLTTDGSITPVEALRYAVSVLRTQFEHFLIDSPEIPFNQLVDQEGDLNGEQGVALQDTPGIINGVPAELLLKPIEELELSVRANNCLVSAGLKRLVDLVRLKEEDAIKIKNFGRKSLNEVKENLAALGLSFGMDIDEKSLEKALLQ